MTKTKREGVDLTGGKWWCAAGGGRARAARADGWYTCRRTLTTWQQGLTISSWQLDGRTLQAPQRRPTNGVEHQRGPNGPANGWTGRTWWRERGLAGLSLPAVMLHLQVVDDGDPDRLIG